MALNWNKEQLEFLSKFEEFYTDPYKKVMTLVGGGGCGKTTVLKEAVKGLQGVKGAAVAHAAKTILQDSLGKGTHCFTIASLLGLKRQISENGEVSFKPDSTVRYLPIDYTELLIIDECSMISKEIHDLIMNFKPSDCKVIFVGDSRQLPSVGEDFDSITFSYDTVELKQPMRFQGSIYVLATALRAQIDNINKGIAPDVNIINRISKGRKAMLNGDNTGVKFLSDIQEMISIAVNHFKRDNSPNSLRILAYKNSTINKLNHIIKTRLYGKYCRVFEKGMIIIATEPYMDIIKNGEVFTVSDIASAKLKGIPCYTIKLNKTFEDPIYVLDTNKKSEGYVMFEEKKTKLYNLAKAAPKGQGRQRWAEYYGFIHMFAKMSLAYACNVHKSQGSTYKKVIVFEEEILGIKPINIKQKLQSLYVACTRAQGILYIYNKKYKV